MNMIDIPCCCLLTGVENKDNRPGAGLRKRRSLDGSGCISFSELKSSDTRDPLRISPGCGKPAAYDIVLHRQPESVSGSVRGRPVPIRAHNVNNNIAFLDACAI